MNDELSLNRCRGQRWIVPPLDTHGELLERGLDLAPQGIRADIEEPIAVHPSDGEILGL